MESLKQLEKNILALKDLVDKYESKHHNDEELTIVINNLLNNNYFFTHSLYQSIKN